MRNNIFLNKNFSKLGDSIVNVVGSIVKTQLEGHPTGIKVKDKVLSDALKIAGLRKVFPKRLSVGDQGDIVEAIFAYLWLKEKLDIKMAAEIIKQEIEKEGAINQIKDATFEDFLFAKGFAKILIIFYKEILRTAKHF